MKLFGISVRAQAAEQTAQARVDSIVSAARRHAAAPAERRPQRTAPLPQTDRTSAPLDLRIEQELHFARRLIEGLGDTLSDDPILVHRHGTALQAIDVLTQTLGHLANVVGALDREAAVERIGMHELKARLQRSDGLAAPAALNRTDANPFSRH